MIFRVLTIIVAVVMAVPALTDEAPRNDKILHMISRVLTIVVAIVIAVPALADEAPRKIDFSHILIGPDGPFKDCRRSDEAGKCVEQTNLTLGRICLTAAAMPDKGASPADQVAHGRLAMKLLDAKELELSIDDIKFLKDQIGKLGYNTLAVYQAIRMLDPTVDK